MFGAFENFPVTNEKNVECAWENQAYFVELVDLMHIFFVDMADNDELVRVRAQIRRFEDRMESESLSDAENTLLAALYSERARLAGNNCVVFIMLLLSGDFISSSG